MSLSIVLVQKNGDCSNLTIKAFNAAELYKKCGYKTENDFTIQATYELTHEVEHDETQTIQYMVYGKSTGRAGSENKYEFPPLKGSNIDSRLLFGTCAIVAINQTLNQYAHLTVDGWTTVYDQLHGGFDDLDGSDASVVSEEDDVEDDDETASHVEDETDSESVLDSELSEESYLDE